MKPFQKSLRLLIAGSSIAGFVAGWALLAHSGKPAAAATVSPAVQALLPGPMPSVPSLQNGNRSGSGLQPIAPLQSPSFTPRLRTRGS